MHRLSQQAYASGKKHQYTSQVTEYTSQTALLDFNTPVAFRAHTYSLHIKRLLVISYGWNHYSRDFTLLM